MRRVRRAGGNDLCRETVVRSGSFGVEDWERGERGGPRGDAVNEVA